MKRPVFNLPMRDAALAALLLIVGCSKPPLIHPVSNQPPTVRLTQAPVSSLQSDSVFYAYRINWVGYDPDGRVDYYMYAIDPPSVDRVDSTWTRTTRNEEFLFFKARNPDRINPSGSTADEFHVFAIVAVDNQGLSSAPVSRAFFTYTVAPVVTITDPRPGSLRIVSPSVHITWEGRDPDGVFTQKPLKYKFRLFKSGSTPADFPFPVSEADFLVFATANLDSVRKGYAPTFPGWDSSTAETTEAQYSNLVPNTQYLFIVTGFDEAGAYDPVFSLSTNVLQLYVTFAGNAAPRLTIFNDFFSYTWPIGGPLTDPRFWFNIEVPGGTQVTFNWFASPRGGASIRRYRWVMDLVDLDDETPRTNELDDYNHWSAWGINNLSGTLRPFLVNGEQHNFIVQAEDNNNLRSTSVVSFRVVLPTLEHPLLIVNDTRFVVDDEASGGGVRPPSGAWPTAAELDTFLVAQGGHPWNSYDPGTLSSPGLFAGYRFDTLGTRGLRDAIVPLSRLATYAHVVWLTDQSGAGYSGSGFDRVRPITSLREMSSPNRANTLATYIRQGGQAWLLGGGIARANLEPFEGAIHAPNPGRWNERDLDLVAGRMMYDFVHLRSEISGGTGSKMLRGARVPNLDATGQPDGTFRVDPPGRGWAGQPNYSGLPELLELRREPPNPDPVPPGRTSEPTTFYQSNFGVEVVTQANFIREDLNGTQPGGTESTLDTLYHYLNTQGGGFWPIGFYYHGLDNTPLVYMGFSLWAPKRAQAIQLVDFVLQDLWGFLPPSPDLRRQILIRRQGAHTAALVSRPPANGGGATPVPRGLLPGLGVGRTAPRTMVPGVPRPQN